MGLLHAVAFACLVAIARCDESSPEAKRKKIKMRSSKQLRQMLHEAEVDVPAGTTLQGLREIAYNHDGHRHQTKPENATTPRETSVGLVLHHM